jgi:hypothetical protein
MQFSVNRGIHALPRFLLMLWAALALAGCAVQFVADYDSTTFEEIIAIGKKVDLFYGDLLETPAAARPYSKYADKYVDIEADLRSLYIRNKARPLNQDSTDISDIILKLWLKYKGAHSVANGYPDGIAKLDRARFTRLFVSAANAEAAKKLDSADRDAAQESRQ